MAREANAEQAGAKDRKNECSFVVGQRVISCPAKDKEKDPQLGTVRYVGPVQGQQGLWVGVDWDSGDGRHDGSLDGVRYFEARRPTSASFVRPHLLSAGCNLHHAITSRYKANADPSDDDGMYLLSVRQKRVTIELVGKDKIENKQNNLEDLTSASLVYKGVVSAGELEGVLPNLKELDLTGNLLPDWQAVNLICDRLPALRVLDLSRNRMQLNNDFFPALSRLQTLVLNFCQISWGQVEILKHSLPELEELHLCGNEISVLEVEEGGDCVEGFKQLRLLNLENNHIESWEELLKLSKLESLEQLQVSHNRLKKFYYPDWAGSEENQRPFLSLRCLLLAGNAIEDWGSIDALNLFPKLTEVRLSDNPLTDLHVGGAPRFLLVARLANILVLNGSEIKQRERKDSEIRYVHFVMNTMPACEEEGRLHAHPRFLELKKLYDLDEEQPHLRKDAGSARMADNLRAITIVCVAPSVGEKAPAVKKLPLSTTIGKLKLVCESLFKVKASKQRLYLREQDVPVPVPLTDDLESLRDIGVGLETTILVDELGT
ncbi:hypothetical protein GOP47_0020055 [Adiantum capillus-veneris]|uniref:CAP-Gly domain-containing protein n=1 Tax=Adiantum capillus-veneris TaxID=13818 RepID=A0A9D4UCH4_ADICA|nr:hypothetical protein GOP47_0020055 [Adiantum capillus-veneris]